MVRSSLMAAVVALGLSVVGSASAREEASGTSCVPDPGNLSAVICTIGGGGSGPSTFLGAFASDNNGKGGWVEFYSDDDGEWWVEHHADGGTSVGWEAGAGGNYLTGPKLSFGSKEGSYANKTKPKLSGKATKGLKRSFASAKVAATVKTATLASMVAPTSVMASSGPINVSLTGTGQCKANIIVQKNGQFVSSSGIVPMSFPSKRTVALPSTVGEYTVSLQGRDGCLGQSKTVTVSVTPARMIVVRPSLAKL